MKVVSKDFYSNCLIESIKAKIKHPMNVHIMFINPFLNDSFCPHFMWSDGKYDYDFGGCKYDENTPELFMMFKEWTIHKGHIRQRPLGSNKKWKQYITEKHKRNAKYEEFFGEYSE